MQCSKGSDYEINHFNYLSLLSLIKQVQASLSEFSQKLVCLELQYVVAIPVTLKWFCYRKKAVPSVCSYGLKIITCLFLK